MPWSAVLPAAQLPDGAMVEVEVDGRRLVVARIGGALRAFAALCPHASAPLVAGDLRAGYVICPLHAYRFALSNGRCLKPPDGPRLRLYPAMERAGQVWVEV